MKKVILVVVIVRKSISIFLHSVEVYGRETGDRRNDNEDVEGSDSDNT